MFRFRLLPWEYGVRNLLRRPGRSALTLSALTLVVLLVFILVGFIRGLESNLAASGDARVVLVHSLGASENLENSSIPARTAGLLTASLDAVERRYGAASASPELYLGTRVGTAGEEALALGLVRGVTPAVLLVRRQVQIMEGNWPGPGEVLAGRLASTKLGRAAQALAVGQAVTIEGRSWTVSGRFAAPGSALESELWCPLEDLQQAMKRQDLSLVALTLARGAGFADLDEFCKERLDLELQATPEAAYYAALQRHYQPVRALVWLVVCLVASAGVFAGLNTMYGAVVGRVRELATLQTLGFVRRAIALALIQEAMLLAAGGSLLAAAFALLVINGTAVRFTMGAFLLRIDSVALLIGCGTGLLLGVIGAIPPALRAMRLPIAEGLKAV
ncbi:MAG: ABC transporter permease [Planctomycetota bacterium]|nr:MAG: ABC transporter permease [Planctomycetota bacterium]